MGRDALAVNLKQVSGTIVAAHHDAAMLNAAVGMKKLGPHSSDFRP